MLLCNARVELVVRELLQQLREMDSPSIAVPQPLGVRYNQRFRMSGESILHAGAADNTAPGEYRGAPAPAQFDDARAEYLALRDAAGMFQMPWSAKLVVSGADRVRWLNGMVTNNIRDLAPGHGVYAFLLTAQGRILADMDVYHRDDYLLVTTDVAQVNTIHKTFDQFIIM